MTPDVVPPTVIVASRAGIIVTAMLCGLGCDGGSPRPAAVPVDELTYPIPLDGLSVKRVVEDAERILGRRISCSECALAQNQPIQIAGVPRAPKADALRLFQAVFMTLQLGLVEPAGMEPLLVLECLDSSGRSIRRGRFVWVDDVASELGQNVVNTVILTRHRPVSEMRDAAIPLLDAPESDFNEVIDPNGWIVRAPPATILKMLAVVRALDLRPRNSVPTTR